MRSPLLVFFHMREQLHLVHSSSYETRRLWPTLLRQDEPKSIEPTMKNSASPDRRRLLSAGSALALGASAALASPSEPDPADLPVQVRLIVPSPPSGAPDLVARAFAEELAQMSQLRPMVYNVDGANGEIALSRFKSETPDGHTWLLSQDSVIVINPSFYPRPQPDALDGLQPVACLARNAFLLVVAAGDPMQSLDDLIATAARASKPLHYGSGGVGSLNHIAMESLAEQLGVPLTHVPYRGNSPAVQGLLRGDVRVLLAGGSAVPLVRAGRLRVLAVSGPGRLPNWPEVPALAERAPGLVIEPWFGLFALAKTPRALQAAMGGLARDVVRADMYVKRLHEGAGVRADYLDAATLEALVRADRARYAKVIARWPTAVREQAGGRV